MADQQDDALIREVNDELREEQMKRLWQRFGPFVIGAAILVIVIVAGYQGWNHYTTTTRMEEGERYASAQDLARAGDVQGAMNALSALSADANTGYGVLAQFDRAALLAQNGNHKEAALAYEQIARDGSVTPTLSGLANLLGALIEIDQGGYDADAMAMRLEAMAGEGQPYRHSARELMAIVALENGDTQRARELLEQVGSDASAPQSLAERARNLIQGMDLAPGQMPGAGNAAEGE